MKIISVDNFNRDEVSDKLIAENVNNYYGNEIVKFLNKGDENSQDFYKLVENDHKLYKYEI